MAKIMFPGHRIPGYTIVRELSRGANSIAYQAEHEDGRLIFLKQYKVPTPSTSWYGRYVEYEKEKKRRIDESKARDYCLAPLEIFEAEVGSRTLFQAFEFVERGEDLRAVLRRLAKESDAVAWNKRLLYAKVFLAALEAVTDLQFVHGDLKPENIHLIENLAIEAGYRPKLIDMDASLLTDVKAPWDGASDGGGYVGTPNYYSPEHASVPIPASDVFTASLILHELLCKDRPFREYSGASEVAKLIRAAPAPTPILRGTLGDHRKDDHLKKTLRECLSLDPKHRPSISSLREAVLGKALSAPLPPKPPTITSPPSPPPRKTLRIHGPSGTSLDFNITTDFDHALAKQLSRSSSRPRGRYFTLSKRADGWWIEPPKTASKCCVSINGAPVAAGAAVAAGSSIELSWASDPSASFTIKVDFV
jgi:serine/threonine protein kinase